MIKHRSELMTGLRWGLYFSALYSCYALLLLVIRGPGPFQRAGIPPVLLFICYLAAGIAGGALVGVFWRIGRSLPGAVVLGWLGAAPWFFLMSMTMLQPGDTFGLAFVTIGGSLLLGSTCGAGAWYLARRGR